MMWFVGRKIKLLFKIFPKQFETHVYGRHDMTGFFFGRLIKMFDKPKPGKLLKKLVKKLKEAADEDDS